MMRLIQILGNRKFGFLSGMAVVLNLIIGSTVMNFYPEVYPPFFNFDINFFFEPLRPLHAWFYLLMITTAVMGGSIFFSTLESILGIRYLLASRDTDRPARTGKINRTLAAIFVHMALIAALFAHLIDGLHGHISRVEIVGSGGSSGEWTPLPGIGKVRLESAKNLEYPDGSRRDLIINATFLLNDSSAVTKEISYNSPATFFSATRELLIQDGRNYGIAVILRDNKDRDYSLPINKTVEIREGKIEFSGIFDTTRGVEVAEFLVQNRKESGTEKQYILMNATSGRYSSINLDGNHYRIHKTEYTFVLTALLVYNPSIAVIAVSIVLAVIGVFFMFKAKR